MSKEQQIIAKKIESGEYFTEAMNWFHSKFTRPRTEFSYFFIICLLSLITLCIGIGSFSEIFPLAPGKNFVVSRYIMPKEHLTIKAIQAPGETANDGIMKFMLRQYVVAREEYIEDRLDRNFQVVKQLSDPDVFAGYEQEISTTNPDNPVIFYGKRAVRDIVLDKIRLLDRTGKEAHNGMVVRAIVNYTTILTYVSDNTQQATQQEADITFNYNQIKIDQKTGVISETPKMVITGYKRNTVKNNQPTSKRI